MDVKTFIVDIENNKSFKRLLDALRQPVCDDPACTNRECVLERVEK